MQTFLPYADFERSAIALDNKRLQKQIVECKQILMTICGSSNGWRNHPAIRQWIGFDGALAEYAIECCDEHIKRGYRTGLRPWFMDIWQNKPIEYPPWLGYEPFHSMHRSVLLAKNYDWYWQFGWSEQPAVKNEKGSYPYLWPSKMEIFKNK